MREIEREGGNFSESPSGTLLLVLLLSFLFCLASVQNRVWEKEGKQQLLNKMKTGEWEEKRKYSIRTLLYFHCPRHAAIVSFVSLRFLHKNSLFLSLSLLANFFIHTPDLLVVLETEKFQSDLMKHRQRWRHQHRHRPLPNVPSLATFDFDCNVPLPYLAIGMSVWKKK